MPSNNTDGGKIVATQSVPPTVEDCKALDSKNESSRNDMDGLFNQHKDAREQNKNSVKKIESDIAKPKTVSSAKISSPTCSFDGKSVSGTSSSSVIRESVKYLTKKKIDVAEIATDIGGAAIEGWKNFVLSPTKKDYEKGIFLCEGEKDDPPEKKANKTNYKPFPDQNASSQTRTGCHAEAGILANLGKAKCLKPGASVTFKIDWPDDTKPCMPCGFCLNMMCIAKQCGVDISICSKSNSPVKVEDDDCPDKPSVNDPKYKKLEDKVMENIDSVNLNI